MPQKTTAVYPQPGSNAERILNHIIANPGVSVNGILNALGMNPSPTRKCLTTLIERGFIEDRAPSGPVHQYHAKDSRL